MMSYLVLVGAVFVAVLGACAIVQRIRFQSLVRRERRERLEQWTEMARARGFEVVTRGDDFVMRGTVASRSFEIDGGHFFTYGMDNELALHFPVEDQEATLAITGWRSESPKSPVQSPTGNAAFDARYTARANEPGMQWLARVGPSERQLLLDHPELQVVQGSGQVWIRLPYRIGPADLDAACRLVASVWGVP